MQSNKDKSSNGEIVNTATVGDIDSIDEEEHEHELRSISQINEKVENDVLSHLGGFEHYNQIDFYKDPESILKIVKGFIMLGGHASINIGFEGTIGKTKNIEQEKEITRLNTIINEYRKCRNDYRFYTLFYFLAQFKEYNDVAFELIEKDSPLVWIIDQCENVNTTVFEYAIEKSNIELAMKMIEKCDISKVI